MPASPGQRRRPEAGGGTRRRACRGIRCGSASPDDASFTGHGTAIISNQEQNETIIKLAYPSGRIIWSFGHPGHPGTAPGYLNEPDDAYLLKDGQVTVADAQNCRLLVINANRTVAHQIGTDGACVHHPPASMGLAERGHAAGRRQPAGLGDQRVVGQRIHPGGKGT